MNEYDRGDAVELSITLTDDAGVPSDPDTLTLRIKPPRGTEQTAEIGDLVHGGTGEYSYVIVVAPEQGVWRYRWESTGTPTVAEESQLYVRDSAFAPA